MKNGDTELDNNTAYVKIKRPSEVTSFETHWNFTIQAGYLFVATGGGPSVMTAGPFTLRNRSELLLDPDVFPDATTLLQRQVTATLTHLPTWLFWLLLAVGVYLVPKYSQGVEWVGSRAGSADTGCADSNFSPSAINEFVNSRHQVGGAPATTT